MTVAAGAGFEACVYALADPALVVARQDEVEKAVLAALGLTASKEHLVSISPSTGWLDYEAVGELWDREQPVAMPTRQQALAAAERAIAKVARELQKVAAALPRSMQGPVLFPPTPLLRRAGLHAVPRPDGAAWDHWLYRAEPHLPVDEAGEVSAAVFGAQVEMRIGNEGSVIGMISRWRPITRRRLLTRLHPPPPAEGHAAGGTHSHGGHPAGHHGGHHGETHDTPALLNYLLEGDGIPQHYLAPYYLVEGHHLELVSACPWSLTASIGRIDQTGSAMTLQALAQGGSGDYLYNWATYTLADPEAGYTEHGSGTAARVDTAGGPAIASNLDLPNGHYVAMVNIKDRATGAFKHHQQLVFSSPFTAAGTPADAEPPLA